MKVSFKIVGMNFKTKDSRDMLRAAKIGTPLVLMRDPRNPYDANAIKVLMFKPDGDVHLRDVGYVKKEVAADLCREWDGAFKYILATLTDKSQGTTERHIDVAGVVEMQKTLSAAAEV